MSDPVTKEINSETLFNSLFDRIQKEEFIVSCNSKGLNFKGLWAFTYWEGANALQSIYFNHVNKPTLPKEVIKEIEDTRLDCDYGSLGYSFSNLKDEYSTHTKFLPETYGDAKGTVCYYDTIIGQQHACFVIIKNDQEILGVLDFLFEGELKNNCAEQIKQFFESKFYNGQPTYLTDSINAYKIHQFEDFINLQRETEIDSDQPDFRNELNNATLYIERLIAVSSKTPLMVVKHKNGNSFPELVCLNFDFIHSIIKHEHRFCPLTNEKNCFHFKDFNSFKEHKLKCDNPFLNGYFYDVFSSLGAELMSQPVILDSVEYTIEIVCKSTYSLKEIDISSLTSDVNEMKSKFSNNTAFHKYRDERVYMLLDATLKNDENIYAFSIARSVTPHLKLSMKCRNGDDDCKNRNQCIAAETPHRNLKQFLSPSTILPVQYEKPTDELLEKMESKAKNIVHFKIINDRTFVFELKKLIARNPSRYLQILKPYLNNITTSENIKDYRNLSISYSGDYPIPEKMFAHKYKFTEVIKGKLNLIEALLQEDEIKVQARKAAISQVFARNGSHNIGSHVLAKMITTDAAKYNFKWDTNKYDPIEGLTKVNGEDGKHIAIANFNSYLRDRMDFLADLSTSTPLMEVSKGLMSDVLAGMDANRILMNYISGVGAFEYALQMRDCRECQVKKCTESCEIANAKGRDISVSMPNDIMGFHALYIIIENIIRNTAKHGGASEKVFFTLEVRSCAQDDSLYEVWLYDTCKKVDELTEEEKQNYKELTGIEAIRETRKIDLIVARQNDNINKPILDNDRNELRHGAWGIIEMKAAAAYLRKIPVETVDVPKYNISQTDSKQFYTDHDGEKVPNILKAVNKEEALGYVFYLMKPKDLLVIDEKGDLYDELEMTNNEGKDKNKLQHLKDLGISVLKEIDEKEVYPHPFLYVIPKNGFLEEMYLKKDNLYLGNVPTRILMQGEPPEDWENKRWVAWTQHQEKKEQNETEPNNKSIEEYIREFSGIKEIVKGDQESSSLIETILKHVWKIWLKHCLSFNGIGESSIGNKPIDSINQQSIYARTFRKQLLGQEIIDNGDIQFNIYFSHHGNTIHKAFINENCKFQHFEAFSSKVKIFLDKAYIPNHMGASPINKIYDYIHKNALLFDGILTNIVIVDERIQDIYQQDYHPEFKNGETNLGPFANYQRLLRAANVHIPSIDDFDLNQSSVFDEKGEHKLCLSIEKAIKLSTLKKEASLIIIHLGVIERILEGAKSNKEKREVRDFVKQLTKKFDARVIITSGRGKPDNLPDEVPFLTYSALSHYAVESPFKALLNQSVQSTRIFQQNLKQYGNYSNFLK